MARVIGLNEAVGLGLAGRKAMEIVSGASGAAGVTFRLVEIAPESAGGPGRGRHLHRDFEEVIHVISGKGAMHAGDKVLPVGPGDTVLVPAGEPHMTRNTGAEPLKLLCFFPVADIRPGTQNVDETLVGTTD